MSHTVISIEKLGKVYAVNSQHQRHTYVALRDILTDSFRGLVRRPVSPPRRISSSEDFWALDDVSFDVKEGEVVGIVGRNGAGKSTLLKILSRITEPSRGRVRTKGQVASLLEVGTGFHPELTGRENIFLNGAILGMGRAEIRRKFDEITAFAEVENFLETPVKRYSSGMYVRLAFAVAAHLEPEILVVDEVLSVGDAAFQKKCIGKMQHIAGKGRTVLFVSHQMAVVQNLCDRGVLLDKGRVVSIGSVQEIIRLYSQQTDNLADLSLRERSDRTGSGDIRVTSIRYLDARGDSVSSFTSGQAAVIELGIERPQPKPLRNVRFALGIDNDIGQRVLLLSTHLAGGDFHEFAPSMNRVIVSVPRMALTPGRYGFTIYCSVNGEISDWIRHAGFFFVDDGDFYGSGNLPGKDQGLLLMDHYFECGNHIEPLVTPQKLTTIQCELN